MASVSPTRSLNRTPRKSLQWRWRSWPYAQRWTCSSRSVFVCKNNCSSAVYWCEFTVIHLFFFFFLICVSVCLGHTSSPRTLQRYHPIHRPAGRCTHTIIHTLSVYSRIRKLNIWIQKSKTEGKHHRIKLVRCSFNTTCQFLFILQYRAALITIFTNNLKQQPLVSNFTNSVTQIIWV